MQTQGASKEKRSRHMEVSATRTSSNNAEFEDIIIVLHNTDGYATSKGESRD